MNITRDSKIAGYPARTVRDALKYVGHGQGFYVGALEQRMKLTRAAAQELATALVSLGMIEQYDGSREREPAYRLTRSGAQLCAAQATKRFRRDVVDGEASKKLLDRAREVNGETSSYAYRVAPDHGPRLVPGPDEARPGRPRCRDRAQAPRDGPEAAAGPEQRTGSGCQAAVRERRGAGVLAADRGSEAAEGALTHHPGGRR